MINTNLSIEEIKLQPKASKLCNVNNSPAQKPVQHTHTVQNGRVILDKLRSTFDT